MCWPMAGRHTAHRDSSVVTSSLLKIKEPSYSDGVPMKFSAYTLLCLASFGFGLGCGDDDHDESPTPDERIDAILGLTGDSAAGKVVHDSNCVACHGATGGGGSGPALTEEIPHHTDTQIVSIIVYGEGSMQAQSALTDQEVADVLTYCREVHGEHE